MLKKEDFLYYSSICNDSNIEACQTFWEKIKNEAASGGKFAIELGKGDGANRYASRRGEWSLPWPQKLLEEFIMPAYNPYFNKTLEEITDNRAREIAKDIVKTDKKVAVMWSGGIDSTLIIVALIKNLSPTELKNITICCNNYSIIENPIFYKNYINNKFSTISSSVYVIEELIDQGYYPILADTADCLLGSMAFLNLQTNRYCYMEKLSSNSRRYGTKPHLPTCITLLIKTLLLVTIL